MARYVHNYEAFGRRVLRGSGMEAAMRRRAERVAREFRRTAPVGDPHEPDEHVGRFRDSAVVSSGTDGGPHHDRAFGRVTVTDPAGLAIEFGSQRFEDDGSVTVIPGSHTLTRALDAAAD